MTRRLLLAIALTATAVAPAFAAPSIGLRSGEAQTFTLPTGSLTNSFFIDVGASDTQLKVELSTQGGVDVDMFLRYGSPFPDTGESGLGADINYIAEISHYRSAGQNGDESIAISKSNPQPVRAGRWFISLISFGSAAANSTLTATLNQGAVQPLAFEVVFDDPSEGCLIAPWTAGALGDQRRAAMNEAVARLSQAYQSPVPLRIQACYTQDAGPGGGNGGVTLARSGPEFASISDHAMGRASGGRFVAIPDAHLNFLPRNHTWFPSTVITKLSGTRYCKLTSAPCPQRDFRIEFNEKVDIEGDGFYYGIAVPVGIDLNKSDFISVAMHEMTHGLGFADFLEKEGSPTSPLGSKFFGYDDIYDAQVVDVRPDSTFVPFMAETDAQRAAALINPNVLRWRDTEAASSPLNNRSDQPVPDNYVRLYTVSPIAPGSTLSHIAPLHRPQLMTPSITNGLRVPGLSPLMLNSIGWSSVAAVIPTDALPRSTQYFDPSHPNHGIDMQRISGNVYFMVFYTYGANGEPEWYIAIGQVLDGVFLPQINANGDSLVRYHYTAGGTPPQLADPAIHGAVRLDFNQSAVAPACTDGAGRDASTPLVLMTWSLGNDNDQRWCMQALIPESLRATPDFTGSWYAGADSGWGFSLLSFKDGASNRGLFGLIYYPDVNGNGRWAYVQTSNQVNGTQYQLIERHGYCRTCAPPATVNDVVAGTIQFTLNAPSSDVAAGNKTSFNVDYKLAPGGNFQRTNSPLILLTAPAQ